GLAVPVEVAHQRDLIAEAEAVVPRGRSADEPRAVGKGDEDATGAAAGEGDDVVLSVSVEIPHPRDLVAKAEHLVPPAPRIHEPGSVGERHSDGAGIAAREGDDVRLAVAVEVTDGRDGMAALQPEIRLGVRLGGELPGERVGQPEVM